MSDSPSSSIQGSELASDFTVSLDIDRRMYREDIAGSIAHAEMLGKQGIVSGEDVEAIVGGLRRIREEIETGEFEWKPELEDIHINVEARLYELIGDTAGRLHTARSRNDQVTTDARLYVKRIAEECRALCRGVQSVAGSCGGECHYYRSRLHASAACTAGFVRACLDGLLRDVRT